MILEPTDYTPSLRWRQGEYQALLFLPEQHKARICPLITIPPIEFDFDLQIPKKTLHEHIHPFAKRVHKKWDHRPCWVDIHPTLREARMDDGRVTYDYVFTELREYAPNAVPVVSNDMSSATKAIIRNIVSTDQKGVAVRLVLLDLMTPNTLATTEALIAEIGVSASEVDLLIDVEAPNYDPMNVFAQALMTQVKALGDLHRFRNYCVIGTGFPESMAGVPKGASKIPKQHWLLYKQAVGALTESDRVPCFGDYTITHPDFVAMDMRMVKPAGKIIYAINDAWHIQKGGSFRDDQAQMHTHSQNICASSVYMGASYSFGDHFIEQCAAHAAGPSNLSRWKCVGINHHMTVVLDDLSSFHV